MEILQAGCQAVEVAVTDACRRRLFAALLYGNEGADLVDKVRILCSVYDPVTGKYRVNYAMYIEIAGGITFILFMIAFAISEWRARRALRRRPSSSRARRRARPRR